MVVLGAVSAGVVTGLLLSATTSHHASAEQARALRTAQLAMTTEQTVLNMQTGLRAYLLTREQRFLGPWHAGQAAFPGSFAALRRAEAVNPVLESRLVGEIGRQVSSYVHAYSAPLIARIRGGSLSSAALVSLTAEDTRRVDALSDAFARLAALDSARARAQLATAKAAAGRARWFGVAGLCVSLLLIALAVYLARAVSAPIRRIAAAATVIAGGDLSRRVPETGPPELSDLAGAFNSMGAALEDDLSRHEAAELALRESQVFLDSIIDHLPAMVFVKEAGTLRFVRFSGAGEQMLGYSRDELIGKTDYDLFPRDLADRLTRLDREVLASGEPCEIPSETILTKHGVVRHLHTRKIPISDADGTPRYLVGVSEDITEQQHVAQALQASTTEAERANRAKSEFLSRMSHELRTPLNAIIGFGQLLEMDRLEARQDESVRQILHGGRHLLSLINEILDISRIESGRMTLSVEPVEVLSAMGEVLALTAPLVSARGIEIVNEFPPAHETYVLADRQRLRQVLLNLLSNAVKYNREGGSVRLSFETAPAGRVRICVADTGPGISAETADLLFSPFERLGAERGTTQGTGLGLTLCRGLITQMGGAIWLDRDAQTGAAFVVELARTSSPVGRRELDAARLAGMVGESLGPRTLLYIEDNLANFTLVEQIFAGQPDIRLIAAMQGSLGLLLAEQHRPDVILLDLHLPDTSGQLVLERLKANPVTAGIPVIILSADATEGQITRLLDTGAAAYVTKPLDIPQFLDRIRQSLSPQPVG